MDNLANIAIALADEGVPVRAIARAINIPSGEIWQELNEARLTGRLIDVPRADWPQNTSRRNRSPEFQRKEEQATMLKAVMRVFDVTPAQARLLCALIHHTEPLSNEQLLATCGGGANKKIIDVQIHRVRKKLQRFGLSIQTCWGFGRFMSPADRNQAAKLVFEE